MNRKKNLYNFFHKLDSYLILFIIIPYVIIFIFSYLLVPGFFNLWNNQFNDSLFLLRHTIKGNEMVDPSIVQLVLNDYDLQNLDISYRDRNLYALVLKLLSETRVNAVAFDILFYEKSDSETDNHLISHSNSIENLYYPVILNTNDFYNSINQNSLAKSLENKLWFPKVKNLGNPLIADIKYLPMFELIQTVRGLGHINLLPDADGKKPRIPACISV